MRKIFGWMLIIAFILYTLLPVHYYTENVVVKYPSYYGQGIPRFEMEERTSQTWFLLVIPLEIFESPAIGVGKLIGYFGVLGAGIWLIKRKKSVAVNRIENGK